MVCPTENARGRIAPDSVLVWADETAKRRFAASFKNDVVIWASSRDDAKLREAMRDGCDARPFVCVDSLARPTGAPVEWGPDARRIATSPNAGGKSLVSEALSMEHLRRRWGASEVCTELEIKMWSTHWKKVDYLCTVAGQRTGVSVSRAMGFPGPDAFTDEEARRLIEKKTYGLVVAMQGIEDEEGLRQDLCFLHIFCQTTAIAHMVQRAFVEFVAAAAAQGHGQDYAGVCTLLTIAEGTPEIFTDDRAFLEPPPSRPVGPLVYKPSSSMSPSAGQGDHELVAQRGHQR